MSATIDLVPGTPRPSARRTLWQLVAILAGAFLLQIAGAALGLTVPLRMALDGRPAELIGLAGSAGAVGFLGGCLFAGFLVRPIGHLNVMSPPLVITEGDVEFVAGVLGRAITQVADSLVREGVRIG